MSQKRPKLPWLPAAKSTTEQRVKFVPSTDVPLVQTFGPAEAKKWGCPSARLSFSRTGRYET